jgi:hypothetical protein
MLINDRLNVGEVEALLEAITIMFQQNDVELTCEPRLAERLKAARAKLEMQRNMMQ